MKLIQHPEYRRIYVADMEAAQRCQEAIAAWRARNDAIDEPEYALRWTYASARSFVSDLSRLFQEYNRVIWNTFHYCRECGGQCCVADAPDARTFDLLAVALLDRSIPTLPENITARDRDCVYLLNRRCSWPDEWRILKCWSFFCLGVGPWQAGASFSQLRGAMGAELGRVVHKLLPDPLRRYEAVRGVILSDSLDEPLVFNENLQHALFEIFVVPFNARYSVLSCSERAKSKHLAPTSLLLDDAVSAFITEAVEEICASPPPVPVELDTTPDRLLADLETLQWIVEGHPSQGTKMLREIASRYTSAPPPRPGEDPSIWYRVRDLLAHLGWYCQVDEATRKKAEQHDTTTS